MAITGITYISVLVRDQDEALRWYTEVFGLEKRDDDSTTIPGFRWLTVAPPGNDATKIALFLPHTEELAARVGQGLMYVFSVDDCRRTCAELSARGATITEQPKEEPWGISAIVADLYGNLYNLVEYRQP